MAKVDKSQFTKSQWKVIKERRAREKLAEKTVVTKLQNNPQSPKSKNAFVLGNGTSRKPIIPEELKEIGKVYGCNALYRTFSPDYLIAVDVKMILEINKYRYQLTNEVWTNPNRAFAKLPNLNLFHPSKGWSSGPTALWLAAQHGYERIFILGFDYQGVDSKFNNIYADTINYKKSTDQATYYGNWLRQTASVIREHQHIEFFRVIASDNYCPPELNNFDNLKTILIEDFRKMHNLS